MRTSIIAIVCAAALLSCALFGCGPDNEELVTQAAVESLERVRTHDAALLEQLAGKADAETLATYGVDASAFLTSYLDGFDYRVDEVTVDDETARATVVLTCKSFDAFEAALTQAVAEISQGEEVANMSQEEIDQLVGQTMTETLASLEAVEKKPIALEFALKDKVWTPTAGVEQVIASSLFAAA